MSMTTIIRKTGDIFKHADKIDDGPNWLADIVHRARVSPQPCIAEVHIISPSRANAMLSANPDNRPISDIAVAKYAADIRDGNWEFNGEPIIIADTGELNDGQNRCCAVIETNKAIEVLVVAGVPRKSRTTTDMGLARTVGHFLSMHNIADSNVVAAIASIVQGYETGILRPSAFAGNTDMIHRHARQTKASLLTYARANLDDIARARKAISAKNATKYGGYSRIAAMLIIIARATRDWPAAEKFIIDMVEGENISKTSPAYTTRERLRSEREKKTLSPLKTFEYILRGWNAHRQGRRLTVITTKGELPGIAK